jgi:HNH endonuclease
MKDGKLLCEQCGVLIKGKGFQIDHTIPEALRSPGDKTKKLTIADGRLLCSGTPDACHDAKTTKKDVPSIARAVARQASHLGVATPTKNPIKSRGFEKTEKPQKPEPKRSAGLTELQRRYQNKS